MHWITSRGDNLFIRRDHFEESLNLKYKRLDCKHRIRAYRTLILITKFPFKIYTLVGNIKNGFVKYFMKYVQSGLIIHLSNGLKNNICQK